LYKIKGKASMNNRCRGQCGSKVPEVTVTSCD